MRIKKWMALMLAVSMTLGECGGGGITAFAKEEEIADEKAIEEEIADEKAVEEEIADEKAAEEEIADEKAAEE